MFDDLLALAASQNKIVGIRVQPGSAEEFQVYVWMGAKAGDRLEWFRKFPSDVPRLRAIDDVAGIAIQYCRDHGDCRGAERLFDWKISDASR